ncbi:hypothetical protein PINS_up004402 [Pythium insidiosum]|nr:hypothetical protein PINS_up004402 [Pythium insidiosum]
MPHLPSAPPSTSTLAVRGFEFVCAVLALGLSAGSFPGMDITTFDSEAGERVVITTYFGGPTPNFALLTAWSAVVYLAGWYLLARSGHLTLLSKIQRVAVDGVFAICTLSAGIALAAGDYVHHCELFRSDPDVIKCGVIKGATAFQFLAGFAFLLSCVMTSYEKEEDAATTTDLAFTVSVTPRVDHAADVTQQPPVAKDVTGTTAV